MTTVLTTLASFNIADGAYPEGGLIEDAYGNLIGTTFGYNGGSGSIFAVLDTPTGYSSTPVTLAVFDPSAVNGAIGGEPTALIADASGNLFGTAEVGGPNGDGTVFELAKTATGYASTPTPLVTFNGADGISPDTLISDANGDLFGTTFKGGAGGAGTVFEIAKTATGYASTPTTLASFSGAVTSGNLIIAANGDLFGMTRATTGSLNGTVFEIAKSGSGYDSTPTTLAHFALGVDGLVADSEGNLFGTIPGGGTNSDGAVFEIANTGSGYASTPTVLASFSGSNGMSPAGGLLIDANGDLFGETLSGGTSGFGTVFEIAKAGNQFSAPITVATFNASSGHDPLGELIADANGNLFGTANEGGAGGVGAVFEITDSGYRANPTATVTAVSAGTSGILGVGQSTTITITMSKAITIIGGVPTLLLNNGGTAIYDAAATAALGDPTKLQFDYTFSATDHDAPELAIVGGSSNGATIFDAGGVSPDFKGLYYVYDVLANVGTAATPPATVTSFVSPASGVETVGQTISFIATMSSAVTFSGGSPTASPYLQLSNGGLAFYNASASGALNDPTKLVFTYIVGSSDRNANGVSVIGGSLNGETAVDAGGNVPDFSGLYTSFANVDVVANPPATVSSVVSSQASGVLDIGQTITFTVTTSAWLNISYPSSPPVLLLNDGGTATYDLTATQALNKNNAPTNSVWDYTVSAADHNVNGLAIVGGNLNGATITDAHGNFPDLSGLFTTFSNLQVATQGIDLTTVAFGAGTTLGYTPNSDNSAGTVSVSDGTHDATISLIGQYAMADFHMASDMHGGTLVSDPSLTGAALTTFLASPHT